MILFLFLITIMPLTKHPLWGAVVADMTLTKYVGGACLLYALFYLCVRRTPPAYFRTKQARWFLALLVLASVSYFARGPKFGWESNPWISYASFGLLFFVTLSVVDSLRRLRWVLLVAIGSVAFASLYVIREWQKYHTVYAGFRPGWVVGDANYFTVSALLCLPLAFYLALEQRPRWERLFCLGCLLVTLTAVILAASRGGFLGLVAAFLLVAWRSPQRLRNLVVAGALLVPLALAAPASPIERLLHPSSGDSEGVESRTIHWKAGLRMMSEFPVLGIGLGNFKPLAGQFAESDEKLNHIAHNAYIEVAAETGLPGLVAFLAVLFLSYRTFGRVRRATVSQGPSLLHQAALGLQAGLLGYAVSVFFVSGQYQKLFWLMVFLSMCLPALVPPADSQLRKAAGPAAAEK